MKRIILIALLAIFAIPANATDWEGWSDGYHAPRKRVAAKKRRIPLREREGMRGYRSVDDEDDDHIRNCKPAVRGVGTQWIGEDGALDAARKDWMERTRYDYGESYLDMKNALGPFGEPLAVHTCGRVSVGETLGQVLYRCQIVARPCRGDIVETEAKTK